jgi:hypothetical protein
MTKQMKQARDEKAKIYGYNNAIYIDKAMLNKEGYQYLEEKPAKDFKEGTDWYRNNVWHPVSQKPGIGKIAVSDRDNNIQTINISRDLDDDRWRVIVYNRPQCINRWAYAADLLPDTENPGDKT